MEIALETAKKGWSETIDADRIEKMKNPLFGSRIWIYNWSNYLDLELSKVIFISLIQ